MTKRYARIVDGVVREIVTPLDGFELADCYDAEFVAACVPCGENVGEGWTYDPLNRDFIAFQEWLAAGNVSDPANPLPPPPEPLSISTVPPLKVTTNNNVATVSLAAGNAGEVLSIGAGGTPGWAAPAAPAGGGFHYSTAEQLTGDYWIDGRPVYRKTISMGALPNNTIKGSLHGLPGGTFRILRVYGYAFRTTSYICIPIPNAPGSLGNTWPISVYTDATYVWLTTTVDMTSFAESYVTIEYVK